MIPPEPNIQMISAAETLELRKQVLRPYAPIPDCEFLGDKAPGTVHFGAFKATTLVWIASLYEESLATFPNKRGWRIRGMATDASIRGFGWGKKLLQTCLHHAQEHGGAIVWCNARTSAIGFYEKQGFKIEGEKFEIPGIGPHYLMVKKLTTCHSRK